MKILTGVVGRILLAVPFLVLGAMHLMGAQNMSGMIPKFFPGSAVMYIYITGVIQVIVGISIITKKMAQIMCFIQAILLIIYIATLHIPGLMNPEMMMMAMSGLLKDTGLLGGLLVFIGTLEKPESI